MSKKDSKRIEAAQGGDCMFDEIADLKYRNNATGRFVANEKAPKLPAGEVTAELVPKTHCAREFNDFLASLAAAATADFAKQNSVPNQKTPEPIFDFLKLQAPRMFKMISMTLSGLGLGSDASFMDVVIATENADSSNSFFDLALILIDFTLKVASIVTICAAGATGSPPPPGAIFILSRSFRDRLTRFFRSVWIWLGDFVDGLSFEGSAVACA